MLVLSYFQRAVIIIRHWYADVRWHFIFFVMLMKKSPDIVTAILIWWTFLNLRTCSQVSTTTDGMDADLWKDGLFKSKVTRYLCFTRVFSKENVSELTSVNSNTCTWSEKSVSQHSAFPSSSSILSFVPLSSPSSISFSTEPFRQCSCGYEVDRYKGHSASGFHSHPRDCWHS